MGEREHAQSTLDKIEELRREANSKYFDVMLMHCGCRPSLTSGLAQGGRSRAAYDDLFSNPKDRIPKPR